MTRNPVGVMNGNFRSGYYRDYVLSITQQAVKEHQEKLEEEARQRYRTRMMVIDVCNDIRDTMTQRQYNKWWAAAPENGFLEYASDYLLKLRGLKARA